MHLLYTNTQRNKQIKAFDLRRVYIQVSLSQELEFFKASKEALQ